MSWDVRFEFLNDDLSKKFCKQFSKNFPGPEIRVYPSGMVLPASFTNRAQEIHSFPVRNDDTFVVSFPKSGMYFIPFTITFL